MKLIKYTRLLAIFSLLTACESIDTQPLDSGNETSFLQTPADLDKAVAAVYDGLQAFSWQMARFDGATNNAYARSNIPTFAALANNQHSPLSGPQSDIWGPAYTYIQRANFIINNINRTPLTDSQKNRVLAELRTLRAFFYHQLLTFFGGVPIVTERLAIESFNTIPRNTKEETFNFIIKELKEASNDLPVKYAASDYGRMTKGATLGILTRVYLYQGDFVNTESTAKQVIDLAVSAGYALAPDFRKMFLEDGEASSEAVLDIQFLRGNTTGESNQIETETRAFLQVQGQFEMFDLYEPIGTIEVTPPQNSTEIDAIFKAGRDPFRGYDPRFNATIDQAENYNPSVTKLDVRKGSRDEIMTTYLSERVNYGANWMAIRYADILLMYAEARNENIGPDAIGRDAINRVRQRASTLLPAVSTTLTKTELREFIRQERRKEFAFEGLWYNDIRRWGEEYVAKELAKVKFENHLSAISANYDTYMLLPIPQSEININPNLVQNSGYK